MTHDPRADELLREALPYLVCAEVSIVDSTTGAKIERIRAYLDEPQGPTAMDAMQWRLGALELRKHAEQWDAKAKEIAALA